MPRRGHRRNECLEEKRRGREGEDGFPVSVEIKGAKHGYMARGDSNDPITRQAQEKAMDLACGFLHREISKM